MHLPRRCATGLLHDTVQVCADAVGLDFHLWAHSVLSKHILCHSTGLLHDTVEDVVGLDEINFHFVFTYLALNKPIAQPPSRPAA